MSTTNGAEGVESAVPAGTLTRGELVDRWIEMLLAVMLGAVTLATAWSGYQAARWGGTQSILFSQAGALRTESMRASTQGGQQTQIDVAIFSNWINAYADENEALVTFYQERFRDEFKPAFEAWLATDPANNPNAPSSPFAMPEYQLAKLDEAAQLELDAEATFEEGRAANQQADEYILNAVILASVLFLSGIVTRFDWLPVRVVVIITALVLLGMGLYNIVTYPIA
jgi:hypothetical protein